MGYNNMEPLLMVGKVVKATCLPGLESARGYTAEGKAERAKHSGKQGKVIGFSNSHGLCYEVRFSWGQTAWFEPEEISLGG
jgi:hypothetical protein